MYYFQFLKTCLSYLVNFQLHICYISISATQDPITFISIAYWDFLSYDLCFSSFSAFYSLLIGCDWRKIFSKNQAQKDSESTFGKQVQSYQDTFFNCIKIQYKKFKFIYFILNFFLSCAILCLNLTSIQLKLNFALS